MEKPSNLIGYSVWPCANNIIKTCNDSEEPLPQWARNVMKKKKNIICCILKTRTHCPSTEIVILCNKLRGATPHEQKPQV